MSEVINREKIIKRLIEDDINSFVEHGHIDTLWFVLDNGFKGYSNYTDDELIQEINERDFQ